jgi:hypothetical protein
MHKKRGQVTVFIVVSLIIVLVLLLVLYITSQIKTAESEQKARQVQHFSSSVLQVRPYVTECIQKQATIAIILAAKNQGYIEGGNISLPPIDVLESSISKYVNDNIGLCTNFGIFKSFNVSSGKINTSVGILLDNVLVDVKWPLSFEQQGVVLYEDEFRAVFPLKLKEMYGKVKNIVEHNTTLDVEYMLSQNLNIEIIGCSDDAINYVVNDKDYLLDKNILRFFFNTGMENLSGMFEFKDGIKYLPLSLPGKHVLKIEAENKTISFDVNNDSTIYGCYEKEIAKQYFTKSVVEKNNVAASVAADNEAKIEIKKSMQTSSQILLGGAYLVEGDFTNAVLILKNSFENLVPKLYYYTGGWEEVPSELVNGYLEANITKKGVYAVGTEYCAQLKKGSGFNVVFVPVSYSNMSLFGKHVEKYVSTLLSVSPIDRFEQNFNVYYIIKPNSLNCVGWNVQNCSYDKIVAEAGICREKPDYIVALVYDSLVGLDHRTQGNISFVGSYLAFDEKFCAVCNFVREFGKFMGLADEYAYLGVTSMNSTYPNCDSSFSGNESISCPKWKDVPGTGCYAGCMYENWYRPEKGFVLMGKPAPETILVNQSIMRGDLVSGQSLKIDKIYFDAVSSMYLGQKLAEITAK